MSLFVHPGFPDLDSTNHIITSPRTPDYNCIGWAAGEIDRFWWPNNDPDYYWPLPVPSATTVEAFFEAFATIGYAPCDCGTLEKGYEKVVLYVNLNDEPTHMARQLSNGTWTSKLGSNHDIMHTTPEAVNGSAYGSVRAYLRRPIA